MAEYSFKISDGIGLLTFSRPEVLNAITFELYGQLRDLLSELQEQDELKVLVLTGEGRAFCSGGDVLKIIGELLDAHMRAHLEFTRMKGAGVRNIRQLDVPIIAAVKGVAAGAVIALAADLGFVAESAHFSFLFSQVGLTGADMGAAYLLPRVVGSGHAAEILMLGEKIDA